MAEFDYLLTRLARHDKRAAAIADLAVRKQA
jgi:hypothetical protein